MLLFATKPGRFVQTTQAVKPELVQTKRTRSASEFVLLRAAIEPRYPLIRISMIVPYKDLLPDLTLLEIVFE